MGQTQNLNRASSVRPGEELEPRRLGAYLREKIPGLTGTPEIRQFRGGASNLTYELIFPQRSLILRRPPFGTKARSAHDMFREFDIQQRLKPHFPKVPEIMGYEADPALIGSDFYVMEKLAGFIPRKSLPKDWQPSEEEVRAFCRAAIDQLVELHEVDYRAAGLEAYYKGEGYVERQVKGWSKRFRKARTPDVPDGETVMDWLETHRPPDEPPCLIHNDFRFDNLVFDPDDLSRVIGLLDWEMATVGDPLMDLGGSLAYWVEAKDPAAMQLIRRQPTHLKGMLSRDELVAYYFEKRNREPQPMTFYYVFGLFRLAGIVQQIYYRYYHRQTRNPQFRIFGVAARLLLLNCQRLIARPSGLLSGPALKPLDNLGIMGRFLGKRFF